MSDNVNLFTAKQAKESAIIFHSTYTKFYEKLYDKQETFLNKILSDINTSSKSGVFKLTYYENIVGNYNYAVKCENVYYDPNSSIVTNENYIKFARDYALSRNMFESKYIKDQSIFSVDHGVNCACEPTFIDMLMNISGKLRELGYIVIVNNIDPDKNKTQSSIKIKYTISWS